jgi:hypothetical protein
MNPIILPRRQMSNKPFHRPAYFPQFSGVENRIGHAMKAVKLVTEYMRIVGQNYRQYRTVNVNMTKESTMKRSDAVLAVLANYSRW